MKRNLLLLAVMVVASLSFTPHNAGAVFPCIPGDSSDCCGADSSWDGYSRDLGVCDTIYVETFDEDKSYEGGGCYDSVRVAIYVTHDSNTFWRTDLFPPMWVQDSIAGFVVPLTFWHQPPGYADSVILPTYDRWNNTTTDRTSPGFRRSIFRDLVNYHTGEVVDSNRLAIMTDWGWDPWTCGVLVKADTACFYAVAVYGRSWWEGSRVLLATLTFLVYMNPNHSYTEIGIDSASWFPGQNQLTFTRPDARIYFPRHFLPVIDTIGWGPHILSIADVGNDQGRQVRLIWARCAYDISGWPTAITQYSIWRRAETYKSNIGDAEYFSSSNIKVVESMDEMVAQVSQAKPGDRFLVGGEKGGSGIVWVFITTVPAMQFEEYAYDAPTDCDATVSDTCWSVFFVAAHTQNPTVHFDSDPDSGYSLDNIPPLPIHDMVVNPSSWFTLTWTVPGEYVGEHPISKYEIRYDTIPVGDNPQAWWDSAEVCAGEGFFNLIVNEEDSFQVAKDCGCHPHVYFAIKGLDDRPNYSEISNIVRFTCGDANGDGIVSSADIVYLINYLFIGGPPPVPLAAGDANCDGAVSSADVVYLINYLFISGPKPCGP